MNSHRISMENATENIHYLPEIEADDSDAGSQYDEGKIEDDDFEIEKELGQLSSDEEDDNENLVAMHVYESIQSVIRSTIGDQSTREFESSADKTSKAGVVWNKLDIGSSKKARNRINFSSKTGSTRFATTKIDETALSAFRCLFDDSMIKKIIIHTNSKAERCDDGFRIDDEIFMRFICLLICRGVFQ